MSPETTETTASTEGAADTAPNWLNDEEQDFWRLLLQAMRKLDRAMDDTLQEGSELSSSEYSVLVVLSEAGENYLRLRDICAELQWDRSRTSHQITRMERRGLVTKHKSEGDARGVIVKITDEGQRRIEAAAPGHVDSIRRIVFEHLDKEDIPTLTRFLNHIVNAAQATGEELNCCSVKEGVAEEDSAVRSF